MEARSTAWPTTLPPGINSPNPVQDAANAAATINGVPVSSATNAMANVLDGVSLNLTAETVSP